MDKVTDKLFECREWKTWASYVVMLNNKKDTRESIAGVLTIHYGADGLSKLLASAAKESSTKDIVRS